jgi:hypothetical protein
LVSVLVHLVVDHLLPADAEALPKASINAATAAVKTIMRNGPNLAGMNNLLSRDFPP